MRIGKSGTLKKANFGRILLLSRYLAGKLLPASVWKLFVFLTYRYNQLSFRLEIWAKNRIQGRLSRSNEMIADYLVFQGKELLKARTHELLMIEVSIY